MNHERICSWLGLPTGAWPPDHYRLLGIAPGPADPAQIEAHVFERMETVRRYQLQAPELATEAMNRLAQAFVCLTNPDAKKLYDAHVLVPPPRRRGSIPALPAVRSLPQDPQLEEIAEQSDADPLSWMYGAGPNADQPEAAESEELPTPAVTPEAPTTIIEALDTLTELASLPVKRTGTQEPGAPAFAGIDGSTTKADPILEAARSSEAATRGLHTKRSLYHRIAKTRALCRAWDEAGAYMANPERRLTKPVEATELIFLLGTIRSLLKGFPPLLGKAGQPGYLVVALARQQVIVPTYQTLLPSQRETLARDWEAGRKLLEAHRDFLRVELRLMRRRSLPARITRVTRHFVGAHPGMILLVLAMLALGVALWRTVYLGAMTGNHEPIKVAHHEERPTAAGPPRSSERQNPPPKKAETVKVKEPLPEPVKHQEKPVDIEKAPEPPGPEEKSTEPAPSPVEKKEGEENKFRVLIPPFHGGDEKTSLYGIRGLAFVSGKNSSNLQFFSCNRDFVTLWEMNDNQDHCGKVNERPFPGNISVLAGCPKSGRVAFGCEDGTIFQCNREQTPADAKVFEKLKHKNAVNCLAFSPRGSWLASVEQDGPIQLFYAKQNSVTPLPNDHSGVRSLAFVESGSPPRPLLVSGYADGSLCLWKVNSSLPIRVITGAHDGEIKCVACSPDGKVIVTGGTDGIVQAWRLTRVFGKITGLERISTPLTPHKLDRPVTFLAFSIDSRHLLMAFSDRVMEIMDMRSNRKVVEDYRCPDLVSDALFAPDGKTLLIGHSNGTMTFYALPKQLHANVESEK